MTPDTSGPASPQPFAFYDPETSCWRTSQLTFDSASTKSSLTLPAWGMTRAGALYELPTPERPTGGHESSSLLPTPVTEPTAGNGHARHLGGEVQLLPTPRTSDTNGPGEHGTGGPDLRTAVSLLPTPTAQDSAASGGSTPSDVTLTDAVVRTELGARPNPRHTSTPAPTQMSLEHLSE